MTTMTESLESATAAARRVKVESTRRGSGDLFPTILAYRGDTLVALVEPTVIDRDAMLAAARMTAFGFDADVLTLTFETFYATAPLNPATGESWGPGEMQDTALNHGGRESGLITDALLLYAGNRAGDSCQRILPYRVTGRRLEWLTDRETTIVSTDPDAAQMGGYVTDVLLDIMRGPSFGNASADVNLGKVAAEMGMSEERARAHQDCAIAKLLLNPPLKSLREGLPADTIVALAAEPGSPREQVIRGSMPNVRRMRP